MTARTHDLAAITALGIAALLHPPQAMSLGTAVVAVFANLIGGIAPDIDQPTAPFWRNLPIGGFIGRGFDKLLGGHRFISHSLFGAGVFGLLIYALLRFLHPSMPTIHIRYVWIAFMIGFASHLVMDTLTKEGVPWLLPVPFKFGIPPIKSLRLTTGKAIETFVIFPGLAVLDGYLIYLNYHLVLSLLHRIS